MKRYLVFCGATYYPSQAWRDYEGSFDSLEEALSALVNLRGYDWYQIVDRDSEMVVKESE